MVILTIEQPGLYINLTGLASFRTPAKIDITKLNINVVMCELRSYGVENWKITHEEKKSDKPKDKKDDYKLESIDPLRQSEFQKSIDDIKGLLEKLVNKEPTVIRQEIVSSDNSGTIKSKKKTTKIDNSFIPTVNLDKLELKKSKYTTLESTDTDLESSVEMLSKINNKNK